jgi:hypothetical protein
MNSTTGGREHADRRADAQRRLLGLLDGLAAELDVQPGRTGRLGGVDDPGDIRPGQVVGLLGEGDGGVCGVAVPADLRGPVRSVRADHGGHLGHRRDLLQDVVYPCADRRITHRAMTDLPDDRVGVAGLGRDGLGQQLLSRGGTRTGQ